MTADLDFIQDCWTPRGVDEVHYRRLYAENRGRLFSSEGSKTLVHVLRVLLDGQARIYQMNSTDDLGEQVKTSHNLAKHDFYILTQEHSWSRLNISETAFQALLTDFYVFLPFLDCVCAFGFKKHEDDHNWIGCRMHKGGRWSHNQKRFTYEIFYTIQFMEKNNRSKGDPWSLGQSGAYQQLCLQSWCCRWIVIQPSARAHSRLESIIVSKGDKQVDPSDLFILPHLIIMAPMLSNWGAYADDLQRQVAVLHDKACFSKLNEKSDYQNFATTFDDCQRLQLLRQKLLRALSVLQADIAVLKTFMKYCRRLRKLEAKIQPTKYLRELSYHMQELQSQCSRLERIIGEVGGIGLLLLKILEFNDEQRLRDNSKAMAVGLSRLHESSVEASHENTTMTSLTRKNLEESQTVKVFTLIAILYLPTSLIASIFSSGIVKLDDKFQVSPFTWIFVVASVSLTLLTLIILVAVSKLRARGRQEVRT